MIISLPLLAMFALMQHRMLLTSLLPGHIAGLQLHSLHSQASIRQARISQLKSFTKDETEPLPQRNPPVEGDVSATQLSLKYLPPPMDKTPVGTSYTSASLLPLRALGKETPLKCSQEQGLRGYIQLKKCHCCNSKGYPYIFQDHREGKIWITKQCQSTCTLSHVNLSPFNFKKKTTKQTKNTNKNNIIQMHFLQLVLSSSQDIAY